MTAVVTAVVVHHGEVLLLRRSDLVGTYQGKWACVSGYLEEDETPEERAVTEIEEETGLARDDIKLEKVIAPVTLTDEIKGITWRVHPFLFRAAHRDISIDWEHQEYRWVPPQDIAAYDTVPRLQEVIEHLLG